MRYGLSILALISAAAAVVALQNPQPAEVKFFAYDSTSSAGLALILTFGIGLLVGLLSTLPTYFQRRRELSRLRDDLSSESENGGSELQASEPKEGLSQKSAQVGQAPPDSDYPPDPLSTPGQHRGAASSEVGTEAGQTPNDEAAGGGDSKTSAVEHGATESPLPPPGGLDPASRMERNSWWGARRERNLEEGSS